MLPSLRPFAPLALIVPLALSFAGCDTGHNLVPDQPPTITLTSGPVDTVSVPQSWLVDISWNANDPDGVIDHVEYAIDPPPLKRVRMSLAETTWVSTRENHVVARFRASRRDSVGPGATASDFHVFVLRAVDNLHARSPNVVRAFYATTVAPDVQITRPVPSQFLSARVPVPFRAEWHGDDPDGDGTHRPASYRTRVIVGSYETYTYLVDPDSLLREGEATGWEEWQTAPGDSTSLTISGLTPGTSALLAVVAVDQAGATTPYLMLDRNLLSFQVDAPDGSSGPRIHIYSSLFDFTYQSGGYSLDPLREIPIEFPAHTPITFHVDAIPSPGRSVVSARWLVDGDVADDTPRSGPDDIHHWSEPAPPPIEVTIPGLDAGEHRLYTDVMDDFGEKSLGIVKITAVGVTVDRDLLVVDDTRREVDKYLPSGCPGPCVQPWPSAAELDTFLYARGGVPWRCTTNPTSGVISPPGLLAGYAFDTLGTRLGLEEPSDAVRLTTLSRYRHVLWLVDDRGAANSYYFDQGLFPLTALRDMSGPGKASALAAYIATGGNVWLAGGGTAYASLVEFNRPFNDIGQMTVFTAHEGELGPGRPMYDAAHVRSALGVTKSIPQLERSPAAVGGWAGHGPDGTLAAPDYSKLPAALSYRDPASDPMPPTRAASQASLYYFTTAPAEVVLEPNNVTEDFGTPGTPHVENALDTLYDASVVSIPIEHGPAMLYYHGRENAPFVFTGFDLWTWTRDDCQALVDFVLGDIWKLPKSATPSSVRGPAAPSHVSRPATSRVSARLDPHRMRP